MAVSYKQARAAQEKFIEDYMQKQPYREYLQGVGSLNSAC
jgi:hypothetical protein